MRECSWRYFFFIPVLLILSSSLSAEPYHHPETGIIFPDRFAGLEMVSVKNYEKNSPGLGISIGYGSSSGTATIYLYTLGMKSVLRDIGDPHFRKHFEQVVEDVIRAGENGPYRNVRKSFEEQTVFGTSQTGIKALSASFTYVMVHNGEAVLSKLYLMSCKNHFLKLRFTYPKDMRIEGEKTLKQLIEGLPMMIQAAGASKLEVARKERIFGKKNIDASNVTPSTEVSVNDLRGFITNVEYYLGLNPDWKNEAWMARAIAYSRIGDIGPLSAIKAYNQGIKESAAGSFAEALKNYEEACRLDPGFPWSANNMAWVLATCPDKQLRDGRRAIEFAKQAIKVPKIEVPDFINTLAAAHAAAGDFDTAVRLCRKSIDLYPQDQYKAMLGCFLSRTVYIDANRDFKKTSDFISAEGYGKSKWGMSKLDVLEVFPESAIQSNDVILARQESEKGYQTSMAFHFRYDMLYRVQIVATGISEANIVTDFIMGENKFIKDQSAVFADGKTAVWESEETRIEMVFHRTKNEAVIEFVSKRHEKLSPSLSVKERHS